jgi:hypothetical protein
MEYMCLMLITIKVARECLVFLIVESPKKVLENGRI